METGKKEKAPNPRKGANIISLATFAYTFKTFLNGYRRELQEEDLTDVLNQHKSDILGDKLEEAWEKEKLKYAQPSLWRAIIRTFGLEIFLRGFIVLFSEAVLKVVQPLALLQLITYYTQNGSDGSNTDEAYMYSGIIVGVSLFNVVMVHHNMMNVQLVAMRARIACCSLIYRKSLKLSQAALFDTAAGQLTNLLSNDVNRFDSGLSLISTLWVCPIQLVVTAIILYQFLGLMSIVGIVLLALCVPIQVYLGKISSKFRLKTALKTDERVRLMNEIVSGIHVIKMYTWEKPFSNLVAAVRRLEIRYVRFTSYVKGTLACFMHLPKVAIFLSILTCVLTGNTPNAEYVFGITSFYNSLRQSVTFQFPKAISDFAELRISIRRLQNFLLMSEIDSLTIPDLITCQNSIEKKAIQIDLENASASWHESDSEMVIQDINMKVANDQLIAIIGPVGSGKSSILQAILKELPLSYGSATVVGKVSYASQEPWLFGASIQQNILFGQKMDALRYAQVVKVCALEHDFTIFPYGDSSLVGERGVSLSGGQKARISLARTVYAEADIYLLDDPLSAVDPHVARQLFDNCIRGYLQNKCRILVTHQTQFLHNVDKVYLLEGGKIIISGTNEEIKSSSVNFAKYLQTDAVNNENQAANSITLDENKLDGQPVQFKEQKQAGSVSSSIYKAYLKAGGSNFKVAALFVLFIATVIASSATEYFLTFWVNQEQIRAETNNSDDSLLPTLTSIYIYFGIVASGILLGFGSIFSFYRFCMRSSKVLHNKMFLNIVYAPLKFFNTNPSGRILNRFSKDIGAVDELLPSISVECINILLSAATIVILICMVNAWLLIATAVVMAIFYIIRMVYLSTSRSAKRLEGITRSPVFTHVNASLQGLTTIRAFCVQDLLRKEFDYHQDLHTSAWHLFLVTARTFGFYLDLISVIYVASVTFSFFISPTEFGGNVGLAITQALNLTGMLQWGTRQWSEQQNCMTSVERVVEYTRIKSEDERDEQELSIAWPENGKISFVSLSLKYSESDPYVLKMLTFSIEAREKVGVVGRTGAGKSSLIAALFQLSNTEGSILIDGVDITQIPYHSFRSKISIIPQEPVLFSGTLRKNLDPFNLYSDDELWSALEDVELKVVVSEMSLGLSSSVAEGGANFSVGQRQLLCLARAIIRKNNILVLDEATANVDPQTDTIIQETIRNRFSECTVLTIAHRLNTVIDSDKILVMDSGRAVEFDSPFNLLQNKMGTFYSMVQQTGQSSANSLLEIATMNYNGKKNE